MSRLNKLLTGHQITDELINRADSTSLPLGHDTILNDGTLEIWTGAGGTGTQLVLTTDYTLGSEDNRLTTEAGETVYTKLAIVNGAYQSTDLYVTYKTVGDYASVESVESVASPIGAMVMFAGSVAPDGWMLCQGQAVSRSTYSRLFASIGTVWGVGDGSTTFNVPDMRESAPVGVGTFSAVTGTTRGSQVAEDTYTLGQFKDDQGQGHFHNIYGKTSSATPTGVSPYYLCVAGSGGSSYYNIGNGGYADSPTTDGPNGTPRIGTVTRGKRIGLNFIIKY